MRARRPAMRDGIRCRYIGLVLLAASGGCAGRDQDPDQQTPIAACSALLRQATAQSADTRAAPPFVPGSPGEGRPWIDARNASLRQTHGSWNASYAGGGSNGYARIVYPTDWRDGDVVIYGADFMLPRGFKAGLSGEVSLMRWDNFPTQQHQREGADQAGIAIWGSDKRARLKVGRYRSAERILVGPVDLPEGRWFSLTVRQRLSPVAGSAASLVLVNGRAVGCSTNPNTGRHAIRRVRFGLVAVAAPMQHRAVSLMFDKPRWMSTRPRARR